MRHKFGNYWRLRPQLIIEISSDYIRAGFVHDPETVSIKNIVAVGVNDGSVIAQGQLAEDLSERVDTANYRIIRPLAEGKITHPQILQYLIQDTVNQLSKKRFFIWQQAEIFVVLADTNSDIERAAYRQILQQITSTKIKFVSSFAAAAIASGLILTNDEAMLLQLGDSHSLMGILMKTGKIRFIQDINVSSGELINALRSRFRSELGMQVSYRDASRLFWQVLQLQNSDSKRKIIFRGRGVHDGLAMQLTCSVGDINYWLESQLRSRLLQPVEQFIEELPIELRKNVLARGIYLSGSLANLGGLDKWLKEKLRSYCRKITQPENYGIEGSRLLLTQGEATWQNYVS